MPSLKSILASINPRRELFKWGPIDGRLIYPDFFNEAFGHFIKPFVGWPNCLHLFLGDKMLCVLDSLELYQAGEKNFQKFILPRDLVHNYYQQWKHYVATLLRLQKGVDAKILAAMPLGQLQALYASWARAYLDFWTLGFLPEIAAWGGETLLKKALEPLIPQERFNVVYERLAAPVKPSFYQHAKLELLRLRRLSGAALERKFRVYQQRHFWILNSYYKTQVLLVAHFKNELMGHAPKISALKARELAAFGKNVQHEKQTLIAKFKLGGGIARIAHGLSFYIWWQDQRKFFIFLANHYLDLFLWEFSRRFDVDFDDLHNYNSAEALALVRKL